MNKLNRATLVFLIVMMAFYIVGCTKAEAPKEQSTVTTPSTISTISTTATTQKITTNKNNETTTTKSTSIKSGTTKKQESTNIAGSTATQAKTTKSKATIASATNKTTKTTKKEVAYCTLNIQCKNILSNIDDLAPGHSSFVPSNGYILSGFHCNVKGSTTAYDVLKQACKAKDIKLTTSNTGYGVYVVGINNLDEKDCGKYSGWKYRVNGKEPNKACDKYQVYKGDKIEFFYVCTY